MRAMVLHQPKRPLRLEERPVPQPGPGQVLLRVTACGLCRTDLHVVDGELPRPALPLVPGHQVVGRVEACGPGVTGLAPGQRLGLPWLGGSCGSCGYCAAGQENLCDRAVFTGYQRDGGFADYCLADPRFCFPLPERFDDVQAAPLLCAGLIGWRALRQAGEGKRLGLYGFGASAHLVAQVALHQGRRVYAFTRPGSHATQRLAWELGAAWVGSSLEAPPEALDAAILFAPDGALVPRALAAVRKGGRVVCAGIHMSAIPAFDYSLLWGERTLTSVANLTRRDGEEFLELAARIPVRTQVRTYELERVNEALAELRSGGVAGAGVVVVQRA